MEPVQYNEGKAEAGTEILPSTTLQRTSVSQEILHDLHLATLFGNGVLNLYNGSGSDRSVQVARMRNPGTISSSCPMPSPEQGDLRVLFIGPP